MRWGAARGKKKVRYKASCTVGSTVQGKGAPTLNGKVTFKARGREAKIRKGVCVGRKEKRRVRRRDKFVHRPCKKMEKKRVRGGKWGKKREAGVPGEGG